MIFETINHIRGATFRDRRNLGFDLTGWAITGQVKAGNTVSDFEIRQLEPLSAGVIEIEIPATTTKDWPTGLLKFDLRGQLGDEVFYTETVVILCKEEVTNAI